MTTNTNKNKAAYWLLFLASLAILVMLLMFSPQWFWLALPTTVTGLALGMDWI